MMQISTPSGFHTSLRGSLPAGGSHTCCIAVWGQQVVMVGHNAGQHSQRLLHKLEGLEASWRQTHQRVTLHSREKEVGHKAWEN